MSTILSREKADINFLQEVDRDAKRSYYIDELPIFQKATGQSSMFAPNFDVFYVPFNKGMGKVKAGIVTMTGYGVTSATRYQLPIAFSCSNLLGNAVKYALPGTRLYIDLMELEGKVVISMKNISREELNVSADELLERFVRGDASRNTEGSGLGLNIAQSLMELQKGQLQLLVDGDLFKVTLVFPAARIE